MSIYDRAQIVRDSGHTKKEKLIYSSCLNIIREVIGYEDALFAMVVADAGDNLRQCGERNGAEKTLTSALTLRKNIFGSQNFLTMEAVIIGIHLSHTYKSIVS